MKLTFEQRCKTIGSSGDQWSSQRGHQAQDPKAEKNRFENHELMKSAEKSEISYAGRSTNYFKHSGYQLGKIN